MDPHRIQSRKWTPTGSKAENGPPQDPKPKMDPHRIQSQKWTRTGSKAEKWTPTGSEAEKWTRTGSKAEKWTPTGSRAKNGPAQDPKPKNGPAHVASCCDALRLASAAALLMKRGLPAGDAQGGAEPSPASKPQPRRRGRNICMICENTVVGAIDRVSDDDCRDILFLTNVRKQGVYIEVRETSDAKMELRVGDGAWRVNPYQRCICSLCTGKASCTKSCLMRHGTPVWRSRGR